MPEEQPRYEERYKPVYSERGGLRIGQSYWIGMNMTWPLAKIYIYHEHIKISHITGTVRLHKSEIKSISKKGETLRKGIRIEHTKPNEKPFILFWSFSRDRLLKNLKNAGFMVQD